MAAIDLSHSCGCGVTLRLMRRLEESGCLLVEQNGHLWISPTTRPAADAMLALSGAIQAHSDRIVMMLWARRQCLN